MVDRLIAAVDRVGAEHLGKEELPTDARFNLLDFVGRDEAFIELIDWHTTFPKVWGILGVEYQTLPFSLHCDATTSVRRTRPT